MRFSSVLAVGLLFSSLALAEAPAPGPKRNHIRHDPLVVDLGPVSGFQEAWDNHHLRGRSLVAEDFDGDGHVDYFVGNVGEESVVVRNLGPAADRVPRFEPAETLLDDELAFVASSADYDNDGDMDLFVGCGGLEGQCLDYLFRNDSTPGSIRFTDVSAAAGIRGPSFQGRLLEHATGGATWGDYDRDGDPDLFVSLVEVPRGTIRHRGVLWTNQGDGTFQDTTLQANLAYEPGSSGLALIDFGYFQNSTWIDIDNDGDLDLFQNNRWGANVLWRNRLVESGTPRFENVTRLFSLPGEDLRLPLYSFSSAVADFNNDGWQDLMLFTNGPESWPYANSHGLFLNREGQGFYNAAAAAGINAADGEMPIFMGSQVADWNADGVPDLFMGGGDPYTGGANRLLLSQGVVQGIPLFEDASQLIDFAPWHRIDPGSAPYPEIPPYPYRAHGTVAADFDEDGQLELAVVNGGRAIEPAIVREPDRLFDFYGPCVGRTLRVLLRGNGVTDGRDAIGARAYVEIGPSRGGRRVFQTVLAGSGFSAQNERTLTFGLGREQAVRLAILWPSGCVQFVERPVSSPSTPLVVEQRCEGCATPARPVETWLAPAGRPAMREACREVPVAGRPASELSLENSRPAR